MRSHGLSQAAAVEHSAIIWGPYMKRLLLVLLASLAVAPASAQPNLAFGEATFGGTACQGSGSVVLAGRVVTIEFEDYRAEAGTDGNASTRVTCNVAIPVSVPAGTSIVVSSHDYRLSAKVNPGATVEVSIEAFFAGGRGTTLARTLTGPISGAFIATNSIRPDDLLWSPCGQDVILRANSSLRLYAEVATVLPSVTSLQVARIRVAARSC